MIIRISVYAILLNKIRSAMVIKIFSPVPVKFMSVVFFDSINRNTSHEKQLFDSSQILELP